MYVLALHSTTELICFKFASGCGQVPFLNLPVIHRKLIQMGFKTIFCKSFFKRVLPFTYWRSAFTLFTS